MSTPDTSKARRLRWGRIVLFVSLALNLLVLGMVVGGALHDRRDRDRTRDARLVRDLGLGPYLMALSEDDRSAIRAAAGRHRETLGDARREMRRAFGATLDALRTEPFDAAAFQSLIATQGALAAEGRGLGQTLLIARVSEMSPAERAAFANRLAQRVHFRGPKPKRSGD